MMFGWGTIEVTNIADITRESILTTIMQSSLIIVSMSLESKMHQHKLTT